MITQYTSGDTVIVSAFDTLKVGIIIEKTLVKAGQRYLVETEDGRTYDNVYVDVTDGVDTYINSSFTKHFLKKQ